MFVLVKNDYLPNYDHLLQDVQKHSVHTLVFRSLKRTHDMFVSDHAKSVALDDER